MTEISVVNFGTRTFPSLRDVRFVKFQNRFLLRDGENGISHFVKFQDRFRCFHFVTRHAWFSQSGIVVVARNERIFLFENQPCRKRIRRLEETGSRRKNCPAETDPERPRKNAIAIDRINKYSQVSL